MSARPSTIVSKDWRAALKQVSSIGMSSRDPSLRAMSTVTPLGRAGDPWASTGLPRLIEARRVPVGARSVTMSMPGGFRRRLVTDPEDDRIERWQPA